MSALSRVKTIKLLCWYHKSVRNSGGAGVIFSQTSIAFARGGGGGAKKTGGPQGEGGGGGP